MTKNPTVEVLQKIKRLFGRERARLDRWSQDKTSSQQHRDRCLYEANQWNSAMSMLDDEIRKAKK